MLLENEVGWGEVMKRVLIAGAVLAALGGTPALAADMALKAPPPPPPCIWCGWYVGANVGGGWGQSTGYRTAASGLGVAIAAGVVPATLGLRPSGVIGGGQIGYNWQSNMFVYGLEADLQGSGIRNSTTINLGTAPVSTISTGSEALDWFGTVRGRVGITPWNSFLLYATGGLAYGQVRDTGSVVNPSNPVLGGNFVGAATQTRAGWTAGAGAEWMFARNLSFKVEYLHVDLGSTDVMWRDITGNFPTSSLTYRYTNRDDIVRAGLNYHFNFGGPAPAPMVTK